MNKILIAFLSILIGLAFLGIIITLSVDASGSLEDYTYTTDLDLRVTDFDVTYDEAFSIGSVNTIEHTDDNIYYVIGDEVLPYLEAYTNIDGVLEEITTGLPIFTSAVRSVSITGDGSRVAVGLAGGTDRYNIYEIINDVYTLSDTGIATFFADEIKAVQFFGTNDQYIASGGTQPSGDFFIYKYDFDTKTYSQKLRNDDLGTVYDITSNDKYIAISHSIAPKLTVYEYVESTDTFNKLTLTTSPSLYALDIEISDNNLISFPEAGGIIHLYQIEGGDIVVKNFDSVPAFTSAFATIIIDDVIVYFSGNLGVYKYKFDPIGNIWNNITNDITTYTTQVRMLEVGGLNSILFVGDINGLDIYNTIVTAEAEPITLPVTPTNVISVLQNDISKSFTLDGSTVTILEPDFIEANINYQISNVSDLAPLISIIPILFGLLIIGTVIFVIKFE